MCGIFLSKNILLNPNQIDLIKNRMQHRGPDSSGHVKLKDINMIHTRLSIQDISTAGHQPMYDSNENIIIIFNGEIYNHFELRKIIKNKISIEFKGNSDTETLIYMYLVFGYEMLDHLNGIFSFCIYDTRNGNIFIARDQFGVKPLYYFNQNNKFIFCSEIKPILDICKNDIDFNFEEIVKFIPYLFLPNDEKTSFQNINKVSPGSAFIIFPDNTIKNINYYDQTNLIKNTSKYNNVLLEDTLKKAIKSQTISDVPLSIFLSGGLDSSSILHFLDYFDKKNINSFTVKDNLDSNFSEGNIHDLPYAREVAKIYNSKLHEVEISENFVNDIDRLMYILEEPISDPAPYNLLKLSTKAKEIGIKVSFSGSGGDEIFTGYRRHLAAKYISLLKIFPKSFLKIFLKLFFNNNLELHSLRRINKLLSSYLDNGNNVLINFFHWLNKDYVNDVIAPKIKYQLSDNFLYNDMNIFLNKIPEKVDNLNKILLLDLKYFMGEHNLLYNDKIGMSQSLEIRVPLLDKDLVQHSFSISESHKISYFKNKLLLKKIMKNKLPDSILNRSKTGFNSPIRRIVKNNREFYDLFVNKLENCEIFNKKGAINLFNLNYKSKIDASYSLYSILCICSWYQQYKKVLQ